MRLLEFGKEASLASVIEAIKAVPESEVSLKIPDDTPWLKNPVNEKILRKSVQQFGKTVNFAGRVETLSTPIAEPVIPNQPTEPEPLPPDPEPPTPTVTDEAGFVVGGDVLTSNPPVEDSVPATAGIVKEEPVTSSEPSFKISTPPPLSSGNRWKRWGKTLLRKWPYSLVGLVILLILAAVYVVYALPRADVKIIVAERPLEREATLTASIQTTAVDVNTRKIPAHVLTSTASGSLNEGTTGTKNIGTQASGTVTFSNNSTVSSKTISAGQTVSATSSTGSATLKYTVASGPDITIPPADPFGTNNCTNIFGCPHSGDVNVTAAAIGSGYNLPANTVFSWDQDPGTVKGVNKSAIVGGSSRNVQVVSQADMDKLKNDLTTQLTAKAKTDITSKAGSDTQLVDKAITAQVVTTSYDHKVGDETNSLNLTLTLSISATAYSGKDLKSILSQTLNQAAPDGYEVDSNSVETSADLANVEINGDLTFLGHIRANLIPKFDHAQLAQNLSGKRPDAADTYLKAIPSVVSFTVNIWPNLPAAVQAFPRDSKRINITVTIQQ